MKTRVISALVVLAIFIPLFLKGGILFSLAIFILAFLGTKEFLEMKSVKKEVPMVMQIVSYIMMALLVLGTINLVEGYKFLIDFRILSALFFVFLIPSVLYEKEHYNIHDAFYLIGGIFFLGSSFSLLILLRDYSINLVLYLFFITIMTDTYAYITGMLIGKHKLLEEISPKKTWEGMIGGTIFGVFIASVFYHNVIDTNLSLWIVCLITLFLSILGQFGDLVFSAIKRYFGKKDFSNIMPGHGGVLDRLDSIIFVMLGFMFVMTLI